MATASARSPVPPVETEPPPQTVADLLERLGNVPARRVWLKPIPGTATEADVVALLEAPERRLCELVDGTLVEKTMGWEESEIAILIATDLVEFVRPRRLGVVLGADGALRLVPGLIRIPDVSFLKRGKLTRSRHSKKPIPSVAPDLAVEVISRNNTKAEIARKLVDYFGAGTRLVWVVDPKKRTVRVHRSPELSIVFGEGEVLDGGDVLPGLRLPVEEVFPKDD